MKLRRYLPWENTRRRNTQEHIQKLYSKINRIEDLLSSLADKCGYAVVVEDFDVEYLSLKKIESQKEEE